MSKQQDQIMQTIQDNVTTTIQVPYCCKATELQKQLASDNLSEHPIFTQVKWRKDVSRQKTRLDYWQWVISKGNVTV